MPAVPVTGRADLSDVQWAVLEPLLPRGKKPGRPRTWTRRQLIDGIRWRVRTGAPWRDVPAGYGPWQLVYGLFRRWQRDGTWRRIVTALQARADAAGLITWDVSVDSTVARAHQHAAGGRKRGDLQAEPPGGLDDEPDDHGLGRSRGGWTSKVHLACEQRQKPLSVIVTAGQRGDSPQFQASTPGREPPMGADYYSADTENGDHMDDPSEDGLFMLLSDLNQAGNTFITITPADDDPAWYASVTLLADRTYEVERADPSHGEQHGDTATSPNDIARDLTIWLAARDYPGRPARRSNTDF